MPYSEDRGKVEIPVNILLELMELLDDCFQFLGDAKDNFDTSILSELWGKWNHLQEITNELLSLPEIEPTFEDYPENHPEDFRYDDR